LPYAEDLISLLRPLKPSFGIRSATYEDCSAILECLRSAFAPYRESYTPEAFSDTVLTPDAFRHRLSEMSVVVATSPSGEVVGTIAYEGVEGGEGHLRGMAVRPEWQGTGLSTSLLETAEDELHKAGCKIVTLDSTEPLRRAMRFYEQNGYRPTGKIGCFFGMPLFEYSKNIGLEAEPAAAEPAGGQRNTETRKRGSTEEKPPMIQRRLRVVKWLSTTPAIGVCTHCSREFKVPRGALRRTADAQASLQEQFDSHKCEPEEPSQTAEVLLREEPNDEEDDEDEDDRKKDNDDDDEDDGYSE
jgi:predicted N-acetyltransferase YhbS